MDSNIFTEQLLPELRFIADIPTSDFDDPIIIHALRQMKFPSPHRPWTEKVEYRDQTISSPEHQDLNVRIYRPEESELRPVIFWIHGGGFAVGDLDTEQFMCLQLAFHTKSVVVSTDYRLAPEHPFPAGINDCYTALSWTVGHAEELGASPGRVIIGGTSSGATLAAGVALMARDRGLSVIGKQILVIPPTDMRAAQGSIREFTRIPGGLDGQSVQSMWRQYLPGDQVSIPLSMLPYASPILATSLRGLPPTYIVTADLDPLKDEALAFAGRLVAEGVRLEHLHLPGTPHFFVVAYDTEVYQSFLQAVISFILR